MAMDRSDALDWTSVPVGTKVVTGKGGMVIPGGSNWLFDVASIVEAVLDAELTTVGCTVEWRLVSPLAVTPVTELDVVVRLLALDTAGGNVEVLDETGDGV